jgi:hypothetical protein
LLKIQFENTPETCTLTPFISQLAQEWRCDQDDTFQAGMPPKGGRKNRFWRFTSRPASDLSQSTLVSPAHDVQLVHE